MKKNESRTLSVILNELNINVDEYNKLSEVDPQRVELAAAAKKLVDEYNELSLLTAYANCMAEEKPLVALGNAYTYATITVKDNRHSEVKNGVKCSVTTRSVEDSVRQLSIVKFLTWANERNHKLAADNLYIEKYGAAREEVNRQWERYWKSKGDSTKFEIGKMKRTLQAMFDALVLIETTGNKNALVATGDMAKYALGIANTRKVDLKKKTQTVVNMPGNLWEQVSMDIWHMVCSKKTYTVLIGDEKEEEEATAETKTNENTEENTAE